MAPRRARVSEGGSIPRGGFGWIDGFGVNSLSACSRSRDPRTRAARRQAGGSGADDTVTSPPPIISSPRAEPAHATSSARLGA